MDVRNRGFVQQEARTDGAPNFAPAYESKISGGCDYLKPFYFCDNRLDVDMNPNPNGVTTRRRDDSSGRAGGSKRCTRRHGNAPDLLQPREDAAGTAHDAHGGCRGPLRTPHNCPATIACAAAYSDARMPGFRAIPQFRHWYQRNTPAENTMSREIDRLEQALARCYSDNLVIARDVAACEDELAVNDPQTADVV